MAGLVENIRNIYKIEELRRRIIYTLLLLIIYRIGTYVTLPGIDAARLQELGGPTGGAGGIFDLFNIFAGGAFSRAGIFALGIMPYITASIIIQLLGAVVPYFQKLQREGEEGRRKITQLTRYGTVAITALQSVAYSSSIQILAGDSLMVSGFFFTISTIIVLTAGTTFVMWLGERITENGIGNGISLIITIGIIAYLPQALIGEVTLKANLIIFIAEIAILTIITAGIVYITQGTRRIPVQYAKRVVGRKVFGGSTQYLPLKVNAAGVMPIIFAQSIMFIPSTISSFMSPDSGFKQWIDSFFGDFFGFGYNIVFFVVCVFFTYFYTAIAVNPKEMADTMKRQGGFVPGIRPGKQTNEFIDNILTRITFPGSLFIGFVAILPAVAAYFGVGQTFATFFGGTSLLIMVGVAIDTLQQVESHLLMRHYDGLMKGGRIKSRR